MSSPADSIAADTLRPDRVRTPDKENQRASNTERWHTDMLPRSRSVVARSEHQSVFAS